MLVASHPIAEHADAAAPRYFAETQHTLADPLLSYWTAHGGLPVFGYPISEAFTERNSDRGQDYQTQYFERNRFEAHPENRAPYHVLLGRLGDEALKQQGRDWRDFPKAESSAAQRFAETGHAIAHVPFWRYWSSHGLEFDGTRGFSAAESLALFGLPLSEPQVETNASGDRVLTQWLSGHALKITAARACCWDCSAMKYQLPGVEKLRFSRSLAHSRQRHLLQRPHVCTTTRGTCSI
jgi:hypothetical protein